MGEATRPAQPWCDGPRCPGCPRGFGLLWDGDDRHSGPPTATLRCPVCGTGWIGNDAANERAFVSQVWWDAVQRGDVSPNDFRKSQGS